MPVARVTDIIDCPTSNMIVTGAVSVTANGLPVGRTYEVSSHGGTIQTGSDTVRVGGPSSGALVSGPFGTLEIVPDGSCLSGNKITLDEYNRLLAEGALPDNNWGGADVLKWKSPDWLGGEGSHLQAYKDAWVRDHATSILIQSRVNDIPPELLAGTAWNEVGGDPVWIDGIAHDVRSFDHRADPYLADWTITRDPILTSAGDVSIQIRRVAETIGVDPATLNYADRLAIMNLLRNDQANLQLVGRHLRDLANVDFNGMPLDDSKIRIVGARYNRGPHLTREQIEQDTSYGDSILNRKEKLLQLLNSATIDRIVPLGPRPVSRGK